jgi:hypothetical protein
MVHSRRVTVARARPRASSSRAKVSIGAADGEQRERAGAAPAGELAQVQGICLAGQAAVPGQEPREREPLGIIEHRLDRDQRSRDGFGGHQAPPGTAGNLKGWAAGPSDERCPQRTPHTDDELLHNL